MSAINLSYNNDLIYPILINNTITLKNTNDDKIVYKVPIPKGFQIVGESMICGANYPTYIITPYQLNYPEFVPDGFGDLHLGLCGLWEAYKNDNKSEKIIYIDTTIISVKDFEYSTLGKFKISKDRIPTPFWVTDFQNNSLYCIKNVRDVSAAISEYHDDARLINEEELISIFALNDFGFEFFEAVPDEMYDDSFMRDTEKYMLCVSNLCLDNWDMLAASMENRNVYRRLYREKSRDFSERFWYKNTAVTYDNQNLNYRFHVFAAFDNNSKEKNNLQFVKKTNV